MIPNLQLRKNLFDLQAPRSSCTAQNESSTRNVATVLEHFDASD